jgi:ABC-type multidrug transport system fused ATPase/permease subunit
LSYDKVFVLDDGKLVESGAPGELLENGEVFKQMVGDRLEEFRAFLKQN